MRTNGFFVGRSLAALAALFFAAFPLLAGLAFGAFADVVSEARMRVTLVSDCLFDLATVVATPQN